ncbi:SDR family oxidoreductase [Rhizobium mongolense]|uniref:D-sorbitol dehydrogenase (Acceptor) n=2 Tax=Rhizobium mongolense TaxID=57676 RepID=A0ABR6IJD3_9HYPH|nr:SDR family oxidoreductase [Rhizobium mongolense]MBB4227978.1 D-sorbitol dehydrogenase (acceptor) [Rhizobium mongolense]TVZ64870.1 D-sorbitol dehydrogenase (acceptor) [Rhizobium mongolense USDA 1844]
MELENKVVIVAGGASGIGTAIAELAAKEGATVIVADRNEDAARKVAASLPRAAAWALDVVDELSIDALVSYVESTYGPPDVLFNSAAIWEMADILETTRASFSNLFSVNVTGLFFLQQAVAKSMVAAGKRGAIVNIASQAGRRGEADSAIYAATKACVISITQSAALALISKGIRVNAVAPGNIDTPMWKHIDKVFAEQEGLEIGQKMAEVAAAIPYGRFAHPEEVAQVAVFLASERAEYVVGQTFNVDGGNVLS